MITWTEPHKPLMEAKRKQLRGPAGRLPDIADKANSPTVHT